MERKKVAAIQSSSYLSKREYLGKIETDPLEVEEIQRRRPSEEKERANLWKDVQPQVYSSFLAFSLPENVVRFLK